MGARDAGIVLILTLLLPAGAGTPFASAADQASGGTGTPTSAPGASTVARDSALGDTVLVLPEVQVIRERVVSPARRLPTGFVTELRPGTSGRALETLSDVLVEAAGVHVQQYGGLGAFSTMSLRGAPAGQVAIFLDGTPLTSAAHGVVNLADLPVTAIERIEIYRGQSPLALGLAGAGGAVNLVTGSGAGPLVLRVTHGSFGTWEARTSGSAARGPVRGLLHLGYQGSSGDFRYPDDNGTPFNSADDSSSTRLNNRFDAVTGLASLTWRLHPRVGVVLRGDAFRKAQGVAGLGAVPARHARLSFLRGLSQLELSARGGGAMPDVRVRGGRDRERSRFQDPRAELGLGYHDTDDRFTNDHLDLELEWSDRPRTLALQAAGTLRAEEARLRDAADGLADPPPSRRRARGASAGLELHLLGDRLLLRAAHRRDALRDRLLATGAGGPTATDVERRLDAPQLGLGLAPGLGLEIRANASRAERPPDFLELFGNQGSVLGNPALRPEQVESWDVGGVWQLPPFRAATARITWAHFESCGRDLILYVRNSQSSVRAQNVSKSRIRGEELELRLAVARLSLSGSFTWQDAVDAGDVPYWTGRRLPQRPGRAGYARLDWSGDRLRLAADVHHLGDNYLDRYNRYRVASRTLWGASLAVRPSAWPLRVVLEGKNLGDERTSDVAGFPLPGRSVFVSCETALGAGRP